MVRPSRLHGQARRLHHKLLLDSRLASQHNVDSRENQLQFCLGQLADVFHQQRLIQRDELGNVGYAFFR